jgi:hypothetical protein
MMQQHYVLNRDAEADSVYEFIRRYQLTHEIHLNRIRFWVPEGVIRTEFALRFAHICPPVTD